MDEKTNVTILAPHFLHSLNLKLEPLIEFWLRINTRPVNVP